MHERFESDEKWLREVTDCLYWSLMYDWDIPKRIRDHYGLTEDYRLYHQLSAMKNDEYRQKRLLGEIPDVLEIDARLTHRAEELFERLCPRPPVEYLDKLNTELERLGQIAAIPESVHDILHVHPGFLAKYGVDKNASATERSCQAEKAYRELDARFVRMTGRRPYADELFATIRSKREDSRIENRTRQAQRAHPTESADQGAEIRNLIFNRIIHYKNKNIMKKKILMLCMGCFLASLTAKAQWVVSDPGNLAQGIINAAKNIVHTSSTATNMANNCAPV